MTKCARNIGMDNNYECNCLICTGHTNYSSWVRLLKYGICMIFDTEINCTKCNFITIITHFNCTVPVYSATESKFSGDKGWVTNLEIRNDGLWAKIKWNPNTNLLEHWYIQPGLSTNGCNPTSLSSIWLHTHQIVKYRNKESKYFINTEELHEIFSTARRTIC